MKKKVKIIMLIICIWILAMHITVKANVVEYKGGAEGLIATPDDFFLNIGELLPGDTEEDIAYIKNSTNDEIEVFFKTEPLDQTEYYDEIDYSLLEKIKLKISLKQTEDSQEQLLYEGNLGAELMSEYISLGEYKKGYDGEFIFKIEVPTELRNDCTLSTTKVKWVFAVEKKQNNGNNSENENTPNTNEKDNHDVNKENTISEIVKNIKTGDNIYYLIGILSLAAIVCIVVVAIKRRKKYRIIELSKTHSYICND